MNFEYYYIYIFPVTCSFKETEGKATNKTEILPAPVTQGYYFDVTCAWAVQNKYKGAEAAEYDYSNPENPHCFAVFKFDDKDKNERTNICK